MFCLSYSCPASSPGPLYIHNALPELTLGRKGQIVNFTDDKSCSRSHCTFVVKNRSLYCTDLKAKFGTSYSNSGDDDKHYTKLTPSEETLIFDASEVDGNNPSDEEKVVHLKLGAYSTVLTVKLHPVVICTTTFNPALSTSLTEALLPFDVSKRISLTRTTHLITDKTRPTCKFIISKLTGIPVVGIEYAVALHDLPNYGLDGLPSESDFKVSSNTSGTQEICESEFHKNLAGVTVLSPVEGDDETLCEAAGAEIIRLYEGADVDLNAYENTRIVYLKSKGNEHEAITRFKTMGLKGVDAKGVASCCQSEDGGQLLSVDNEEVSPWKKKAKVSPFKKKKVEEVVEVDSDATTDDDVPPPTPKTPPKKKKEKEKRTPKPKPPMMSASQRGPLSKSSKSKSSSPAAPGPDATPSNSDSEDSAQPLAKPEKDLMSLTHPDGFMAAAPSNMLERSAFRRPGISNDHTTVSKKLVVVRISSSTSVAASSLGSKRFRKNFVLNRFTGSDTNSSPTKKGRKKKYDVIGLTPVLPKESEREIRIDRERRELERAQEEAERLFKGGEEKQTTKRKRR
ncbi:hypothetical protein TrVE_jg13923 [Triparma verrucosa]|uniref:FHA domain-containing protein n=1 Tax=Triparma verrucosa TaxID=1606542 RepID=A0A9W7B4R2_9STRA|nr:hypothetical protein TrVE_jg13923 [Triparma verrucosa]